MILNITHDDTVMPGLDRDGVSGFDEQGNMTGVQGFNIEFVGAVTLHFEDERDAVRIAKLILQRMGKTVDLAR